MKSKLKAKLVNKELVQLSGQIRYHKHPLYDLFIQTKVRHHHHHHNHYLY